jgi:hypothetical protein
MRFVVLLSFVMTMPASAWSKGAPAGQPGGRSVASRRFPLRRFWLAPSEKKAIEKLVRGRSAYPIHAVQADLDEFIPLLDETHAERIVRVQTVIESRDDYAEGEEFYLALRKKRWFLLDTIAKWSEDRCFHDLKL